MIQIISSIRARDKSKRANGSKGDKSAVVLIPEVQRPEQQKRDTESKERKRNKRRAERKARARLARARVDAEGLARAEAAVGVAVQAGGDCVGAVRVLREVCVVARERRVARERVRHGGRGGRGGRGGWGRCGGVGRGALVRSHASDGSHALDGFSPDSRAGDGVVTS